MELPNTEEEFNEIAAKFLEENKAKTIDEAIENLNALNALRKMCFGDKN